MNGQRADAAPLLLDPYEVQSAMRRPQIFCTGFGLGLELCRSATEPNWEFLKVPWPLRERDSGLDGEPLCTAYEGRALAQRSSGWANLIQ